MGVHTEQERRDARVRRVIEGCHKALRDPRIPLGPLWRAEAINPAYALQYERAPGLDALSRLLNLTFRDETFAVVRGEGTAQLRLLARGAALSSRTLLEVEE